MNVVRLLTLAAFIRSQATLTDTRPHVPGPGCVQLNNEEALEIVAALERVPPSCAPLAYVERKHIEATFAELGGDKVATATALGISLKTLYNRLHEYGVM